MIASRLSRTKRQLWLQVVKVANFLVVHNPLPWVGGCCFKWIVNSKGQAQHQDLARVSKNNGHTSET
eukprot:1174778-Amphidinium_carterae.1